MAQTSFANILALLKDPTIPIYVKPGGDLGTAEDLNLSGIIPAVAPGNFGSKAFRKEFNLRYAYVGGSMVAGISSVAMVTALVDAGFLGVFGASGLSPAQVEEAVFKIKDELEEEQNFGSCLIHSPQDPQWEEKVVNIYLERGVNLIEASAFMQITPSLVRYRLKGLTLTPDEQIYTPNRVMAKVSRLELAKRFFSPPPPKVVQEALNRGWITDKEASLAPRVPMAQDLSAEADSGGHTDFRSALTLWPAMVRLAEDMTLKYDYPQALRVGAAGGLGTPSALLAAQDMGVSYFVTGSINQSCLESGLSEGARALLAKAGQTDVSQAPAADMFELGSRVQVLKYGTLFAPRALRLAELYRQYQRIEEIPAEERRSLEEKVFRKPLSEVWEETRQFFSQRDPATLEKAEANAKFKMALIFRWYLGQASRWAINGVEERRGDWSIFCGPSLGAFNEWVAGTYFEAPNNRHVVDLAGLLLYGAAVLKRVALARDLGLIGLDLPLSVPPLDPGELANFI
ncbi:MAG: PfaD family polyunsaturated fatty acid/polyketide biosynthesis protein [Deltaproteobacteria bacterium]|jgi:PfaD family protein|nr:PfaD family polyunsaturated fatty acid/polyketide biosynthesis protein [Deltaproteobacteria bacterium]